MPPANLHHVAVFHNSEKFSLTRASVETGRVRTGAWSHAWTDINFVLTAAGCLPHRAKEDGPGLGPGNCLCPPRAFGCDPQAAVRMRVLLGNSAKSTCQLPRCVVQRLHVRSGLAVLSELSFGAVILASEKIPAARARLHAHCIAACYCALCGWTGAAGPANFRFLAAATNTGTALYSDSYKQEVAGKLQTGKGLVPTAGASSQRFRADN